MIEILTTNIYQGFTMFQVLLKALFHLTFKQPCELSSVTVPILQMRKLSHKKVNNILQITIIELGFKSRHPVSTIRTLNHYIIQGNSVETYCFESQMAESNLPAPFLHANISDSSEYINGLISLYK